MAGRAKAQRAEVVAIQFDRRHGERFITIFRVGKITRLTGDELCMLRNISDGGAMANVASLFDVGEQVTLDLRLEERIEAHVVWARDSVIGLTFAKPVDLEAILATTAPEGPRPRAPRLTVAAQGRLHVDREVYRMVTTDVSQSGTKLFVGVPLVPLSQAQLWIDGLPQQSGVVRWSANGMVGISFLLPIKIWSLTEWARTQRSQLESYVKSSLVPSPAQVAT